MAETLQAVQAADTLSAVPDSQYGIAWSESLQPLGDPFAHGPHGTSTPDRSAPTLTEMFVFQTTLLAARCDALLRRCEEQERLLMTLLRR